MPLHVPHALDGVAKSNPTEILGGLWLTSARVLFRWRVLPSVGSEDPPLLVVFAGSEGADNFPRNAAAVASLAIFSSLLKA